MNIVFAGLLAVLFIPFLSAYGQATGQLQIDILAGSGERPTYQGIVLKIYQDTNQTATEIAPTSNPYSMDLPLNHRYKIEAYASAMFVDVDFVDLTEQKQRVELSMPIPGSASFSVAYSDGYTPVKGASVFVRSGDGTYRYWTNSTTDSSGNTIRYWLQPTLLEKDHYDVEVSLGPGLVHTYSPVQISPGVSQNIKITIPWPSMIDQPISVSVLDSNGEKISGLGKNLLVEVYGTNQEKITSNPISYRGDAYITNLRVGTYTFRVMDLDHKKELGNVTLTLNGKAQSIQIQHILEQNQTQDLDPLPISVMPQVPTNSTQSTVLPIPTNSTQSAIPQWVRNVADWWSSGAISDAEFLKAIEYLLNNNIIAVSGLQTS